MPAEFFYLACKMLNPNIQCYFQYTVFQFRTPDKIFFFFFYIEGYTWNLVKNDPVVSEENAFKDFMFIYMYTAQEQG